MNTARGQLANIKVALEAFKVDNCSYPPTVGGLAFLIQPPPSATNWRGPYLQPATLPLDPWNHPFIYEFPGKHNPQSYDLSTVESGGRNADAGNIRNWER